MKTWLLLLLCAVGLLADDPRIGSIPTIIPGSVRCTADGGNPSCFVQHPERYTDMMSMSINAACHNGYNPSMSESITTHCTVFPVFNTMMGISDPGVFLYHWALFKGDVYIMASSIGGLWPAFGEAGEDCNGVPFGNGFSYAPC